MLLGTSLTLWAALGATKASRTPRAPSKPKSLRCEYLENPLGLDAQAPRLSWEVNDPRRGAVQSAYRIIVSSSLDKLNKRRPDVWDSGKVDSSRSIQVPYAGPALQSGRRYYWTVRTWDAAGKASRYADPAFWEMGLLSPSDWSAHWIAADPSGLGAAEPAPDSRKCHRSVCLRGAFRLRGPIARARVHVSGLGWYELHINGQRVGEDTFTPGWTHYPTRVQYQTYDVTPLLRQDDNVVGALLGNGWWSGGLGWERVTPYASDSLRLILQLDVEYADGTRETVRTDGDWRAHPSAIVEDNIYDGETYDARLEMPGWDAPGFDDSDWSPVRTVQAPIGRLVAQHSPTIRITDELKAVAVTRPSDGAYVFDFGQNAPGWVRLKVSGPRGTRVQIRFAEVLNPDGTIYTANYRSAKATDAYILKGEGEEVWEPRFTYRGFRYAELTGYPGARPSDALVARVLHTAPSLAGRFECSDDLINRIRDNILWGQRSNLHSVPTDCPQRDERLGWLGDAEIFAPTSCWNMDMAAFYTKWMTDITDSQGPDGATTDVAPVAVVGGPASPGWGDAAVVIPWTVYRFYGDKRIIERNYDAMVAWVEYMRGQAVNDLYEREGYGDWVPVVESPKKPIGAAYYYYSTMLLSKMARAIGRSDDAAKYAALAGRIADAFNAAYFDASANDYLGATQTANILPLFFGIVPAGHREAVMGRVVQDIAARGDHLSTGFLGTAYLMPLLSETGHNDLACRLATQRTYPSWGYMLEKGATTIWERWNSDTMGPEMNSRNHFAFGAVGEWFYEALAGIRPDPDRPGFKHVIIRPRPGGKLKWVRAEYPSMYGPIRSAWRIRGGVFSLDLTVPANATATVHLPTSDPEAVAEGGSPWRDAPGVRLARTEADCVVYEVGAGRYRFTVSGFGNPAAARASAP